MASLTGRVRSFRVSRFASQAAAESELTPLRSLDHSRCGLPSLAVMVGAGSRGARSRIAHHVPLGYVMAARRASLLQSLQCCVPSEGYACGVVGVVPLQRADCRTSFIRHPTSVTMKWRRDARSPTSRFCSLCGASAAVLLLQHRTKSGNRSLTGRAGALGKRGVRGVPLRVAPSGRFPCGSRPVGGCEIMGAGVGVHGKVGIVCSIKRKLRP